MPSDIFEISDNYGEFIQVKLEEVIQHSPPKRTALVVRKVLENLVLTERMAQEQGAEIHETHKQRMIRKDFPEIQAEVDRAIIKFIGAIVSAEGG